MTLSASIVPAPGSSHSDALSRRNCQAGRSSSGVSSTGSGRLAFDEADGVADAGKDAVDDRRAGRSSGRTPSRSWRSRRRGRTPSRPVAPEAARASSRAPPGLPESGACAEGVAEDAQPFAARSRPAAVDEREQRQDRRRGVRGQAVGGALEPRVEEADRVGVEAAPVERGREPLRGRAERPGDRRALPERVVERRAVRLAREQVGVDGARRAPDPPRRRAGRELQRGAGSLRVAPERTSRGGGEEAALEGAVGVLHHRGDRPARRQHVPERWPEHAEPAHGVGRHAALPQRLRGRAVPAPAGAGGRRPPRRRRPGARPRARATPGSRSPQRCPARRPPGLGSRAGARPASPASGRGGAGGHGPAWSGSPTTGWAASPSVDGERREVVAVPPAATVPAAAVDLETSAPRTGGRHRRERAVVTSAAPRFSAWRSFSRRASAAKSPPDLVWKRQWW